MSTLNSIFYFYMYFIWNSISNISEKSTKLGQLIENRH